jgi:hypothetical protein
MASGDCQKVKRIHCCAGVAAISRKSKKTTMMNSKRRTYFSLLRPEFVTAANGIPSPDPDSRYSAE